MEHTDIFQWANKIDGMKHDLQAEVFLFNKNYTPYSIRTSSEITTLLKPVFMYDLVTQVQTAAATGIAVKPLEEFDSYSQMITYTELDKVGRADTLIHLIENERGDIVEFSQDEHEFKRMMGMVAVYTHPVDRDVKFYVFKLLQASASISSGVTWQINNGEIQQLQPDVAIKMPTDNQVVIIGGEIFILNEPKFVKLFNYDLQMIQATDERGAALTKHYKLSMPDLFDDFAKYVRDSRGNIKKLLDVDLNKLPSQETLLDIADNMEIELMTDDNGAIILFDSKDVGVFLDLVNDNYLSSETGAHYLAKSKKSLDPKD